MGLIPEIKLQDIPMTKKLKVFVFGKPMCGKTSFASTFPKPLFISTDGNTDHIKGKYGVIKIAPKDNVVTLGNTKVRENGWTYFKLVIDEIIKDSTYETIVIDLIDPIYNYCRNHYIKQWGVIDESDYGSYSKGYRVIRNDFNEVFSRLENVDKHIVIIDHQNQDGEIKPTLSGKVWDQLTRLININLHLSNEFDPKSKKETRTLTFVENKKGILRGGTIEPSFNALTEFLDKNGKKFEIPERSNG